MTAPRPNSLHPAPQHSGRSLLQLLASRRIFVFTPQGHAPRALCISPGAAIEPYTSFEGCALQCGQPFTMGSFSYTSSPLSGNFSLGRYCCVARDVAEMGGMHPMERVTTSTVSYGSRTHPGHRAAVADLAGGGLY